MALPATEDFTGSNGDQIETLANWSLSDGGLDIQSNAIAPDDSVAAGECAAWWDADAFNDAQYAEGTIAAVTAGHYIGVGTRITAGGNYFAYAGDSGTRELWREDSGSYTSLATTASGFSATDTVRLESDGSTHTPILNGSTDAALGAQVDGNHSSGSAGVTGYADSASIRLDDWEGGNLGAVAADSFIPIVSRLKASRSVLLRM